MDARVSVYRAKRWINPSQRLERCGSFPPSFIRRVESVAVRNKRGRLLALTSPPPSLSLLPFEGRLHAARSITKEPLCNKSFLQQLAVSSRDRSIGREGRRLVKRAREQAAISIISTTVKTVNRQRRLVFFDGCSYAMETSPRRLIVDSLIFYVTFIRENFPFFFISQ